MKKFEEKLKNFELFANLKIFLVFCRQQLYMMYVYVYVTCVHMYSLATDNFLSSVR